MGASRHHARGARLLGLVQAPLGDPGRLLREDRGKAPTGTRAESVLMVRLDLQDLEVANELQGLARSFKDLRDAGHMAGVVEGDLLRERLRERDPLLADELLDVMGDVEHAERRVPAPLLAVAGEGPVALRAGGDEDLRPGLRDRFDVVRHEFLLRDVLVPHPGEGCAGTPFVRAEDSIRDLRSIQDLHHRPRDLLPLVARGAPDPVDDLGGRRLDRSGREPRGPLFLRFAVQVPSLQDVPKVRLEFGPRVAGGDHPLFHVVPEAVERDVDRTDLLASPASGALPGVPRELLSRLHVPTEQEVQRPAHLVLPEREDAAPRRRPFPTRLLVGGADRHAISAHRTRMDVLLNRRHLGEARHANPSPKSGAEFRQLSLGLARLALVFPRELLEDGPDGGRDLGGGCTKDPRGLVTRLRCNLPSLRQGDLLLEGISSGAATRALVGHGLGLRSEPADVALHLGDRINRVDPGHDGRMRRARTRDGLEPRELGLLAASEFLERHLDPHFRDRGIREVVEGNTLHDGPQRAGEGVRVLSPLGSQGYRPPQNPMDFWMRPRGYQDLQLVADSEGSAQMPQPNCFFAASDIISGVHGGSQTMFTTASLTPCSCSSFRFTSWWM